MYWKIDTSSLDIVQTNDNGLCIQLIYRIFLDNLDKNFYQTITDIYEEKNGILIKTGKTSVCPIICHFIHIPFDASNDLIRQTGDQLISIVKNHNESGILDDYKRDIYIPNTLKFFGNMNNINLEKAKEVISNIKENTTWVQ